MKYHLLSVWFCPQLRRNVSSQNHESSSTCLFVGFIGIHALHQVIWIAVGEWSFTLRAQDESVSARNHIDRWLFVFHMSSPPFRFSFVRSRRKFFLTRLSGILAVD